MAALRSCPGKTTEEEERQEAGAAAAKEISMDAAVAALLSEPCGTFTVKVGEKQHLCLYIYFA